MRRSGRRVAIHKPQKPDGLHAVLTNLVHVPQGRADLTMTKQPHHDIGTHTAPHGRTGPLVVRPANSMRAIEEGIGLLMPIAADEDFEADEQAGGAL